MILSVVLAFQAHALKPDFQSVRDYHNQEIDLLLKDYTLEDSLTIRVEITRKDGELKEQEILSLPGLYQKTGEAPDKNIASVLNLYDRKIVFIKKREISDKEIELVKSSLKERLFLPDNVVYTTLDNIPKLDNAVKNLKSDFFFGAYETLIKGGQFLWIIIFSIGFIVALWVLAKVWKSRSENGLAGELTINGSGLGGGEAPQAAHDKDDGGGSKQTTISLNSAEFETFNFESLCQNLNDAFKKSSGSVASILWQYLPDLQTQIQFYEIIRIQKNTPAEVLKASLDIVSKIFAFEERVSKNRTIKAKGFTKDDLAVVSVELAKLKFTQPNASYEKCLSSIYPKLADNLYLVFDKGFDGHHLVLYKIFKNDFMNFLSSKKDPKVLEKIDDLLIFDPNLDQPTDQQYSTFADFLSKTNWSETNITRKTVNTQVVQMIYNLPEAELLQVEAMKNNEELKAEVPSFAWINTEDHKLLKDFFANLSGPELKYLLDFDKKYSESLAALDERIQFRVKERMTNEVNMKLVWKDFRNKIKRYYSYQSAGSHESASKAS